tara:strand:- start:7128 stop:8030 length:903 start_codon:yes stop_codon:yes gene_type:complete
MELNLNAEKSEQLKNRLHNLCGFISKKYNFPGSMPVSLTKNDVQYLRRNYTVCDKTDGTRYFLFCFDFHIYLVDRLLNFYNIGRFNQFIDNNCVYDGELVKSKTGKWLFMIFDVFASKGKTIKDIPNHKTRIHSILGMYPRTIDNIDIHIKDFFYTQDFHKCTKNLQKLPYQTDGFIFTPMFRKIFNGTDRRTYKWKDGEEHTIDFELLEDDKLYLWGENEEKMLICPIQYNSFTNIPSSKPCIVECKIEKNENNETSWVYVKTREDKERPNSMKVYLATIEVIKENITIDYLNNNLSIM